MEIPRNATHRALPDCRTICADRAGVRPPVACVAYGAAKRSAVTGGSVGTRRAGSRSSGDRPGRGWGSGVTPESPVVSPAGRAPLLRGSSLILSDALDAADRALRRDDPGLADGDG